MFRIRTRYKVLVWAALAIAGLLFASFVGPLYASYNLPKELKSNSFVTSGSFDFDVMMRAVEKSKPVIATANMLTSFGRFITACASTGLAFTLFMHYRKRKGVQSKTSDEKVQVEQGVE